MKNKVVIFADERFGRIRSIKLNGEPWFFGKDVALALKYKNPQKAIREHVDTEDKTVSESLTVNGTAVTLINESGLYSLILSSKKPEAKQFRRWVTGEVLPALRRHGAYAMCGGHRQAVSSPTLLADMAQAMLEERSRAREFERKARAFDRFAAKAETMSFACAAAFLELPYGNVTLIRRLRSLGVLKADNTPADKYCGTGLFVVKQACIRYAGGSKTIRWTRCTQKGIDFLRRVLV